MARGVIGGCQFQYWSSEEFYFALDNREGHTVTALYTSTGPIVCNFDRDTLEKNHARLNEIVTSIDLALNRILGFPLTAIFAPLIWTTETQTQGLEFPDAITTIGSGLLHILQKHGSNRPVDVYAHIYSQPTSARPKSYRANTCLVWQMPVDESNQEEWDVWIYLGNTSERKKGHNLVFDVAYHLRLSKPARGTQPNQAGFGESTDSYILTPFDTFDTCLLSN